MSHDQDRKEPQASPEEAAPPPAALPGGAGALVRAAGSFLYVGFLPKFPGTWATAVAALGYGAFVLADWAGPWLFLGLAAGFSIVSVPVGCHAERAFGRKDPGPFVLDEFAGFFLTLSFLNSYTIPVGVAAFLAFRLFDIVKVWPASSLERLGGGWGILLDDLAAGVYANLTLRCILLIVKI